MLRNRKNVRGVLLLALSLCLQTVQPAAAATEELIEAPSGVLLEASTGQILYEKEKDAKRSPASITKIMTLLLIFDALEQGTLRMDDTVTTSAYAKSMGGSQVFLEEGETQSVETLIKCIVIASGNDASVAMAEHISGSEAEFVAAMNARAKGLNMEHTHFTDCCGLTDSPEHYTTAADVGRMSRELITKYPKILEYSSIWMETITHQTRKGSSEFGLTNTNKLLRSFDGCIGLKTGSTSLAKYCVSAVAKRNGIRLISVVMGAPDYKARFRDAAAMLNWGFANCRLYVDENQKPPAPVPVRRGKKEQVSCRFKEPFRYLDTTGDSRGEVQKEIVLPEAVKAPVKKNAVLGKAVYKRDGAVLGEVPILAKETVAAASYADHLKRLWQRFRRVGAALN